MLSSTVICLRKEPNVKKGNDHRNILFYIPKLKIPLKSIHAMIYLNESVLNEKCCGFPSGLGIKKALFVFNVLI